MISEIMQIKQNYLFCFVWLWKSAKNFAATEIPVNDDQQKSHLAPPSSWLTDMLPSIGEEFLKPLGTNWVSF